MNRRRVSWQLFSARRRLSIAKLYELKKITDYKSYVAYCDKFLIDPVSSADFLSQISVEHTDNSVVVPAQVAVTAVEVTTEAALETETVTEPVSNISTEAEVADEPVAIATVWLAGVVDDTQSSTNMSGSINLNDSKKQKSFQKR